jgi:hypothetical protein
VHNLPSGTVYDSCLTVGAGAGDISTPEYPVLMFNPIFGVDKRLTTLLIAITDYLCFIFDECVLTDRERLSSPDYSTVTD